VFEKRVLRRIFGPKREERQEAGEDCTMRGFITYRLHQVLLGDQVKDDELGGACSMHG
jgi:hypothetical protein